MPGAVLTGNINDMPPSTALKVLGLWKMGRRLRFQTFVMDVAPTCSGDDDLQNRILAFVAGQSDKIPSEMTNIVLIAAARKFVALMNLNLNLITVGPDVTDEPDAGAAGRIQLRCVDPSGHGVRSGGVEP